MPSPLIPLVTVLVQAEHTRSASALHVADTNWPVGQLPEQDPHSA